MHRRARHLNPGSAGAVLTLDSRFITGLSDGDPVSTWTDRSGSGNNATGSATARPTFQINEQGGQPAVQFDGLNDILSAPALQSRTVITVTKANTATGIQNLYRVYFTPLIHRFDNSNFRTYANVTPLMDSQTTTSPTTTLICSSVFRDFVCEQYINATPGNTDAGTWTPINTTSCTIGGTLGFAEWFGGNMVTVLVFTSPLASPLRRRLEHAAAFAFKIPCS